MGQGQGKDLPYEIGEQHQCLNGKTVWSVHKGTRKIDSLPVTLFVFEGGEGKDSEMKAAKAAYIRLKTFRHPNVVKFIDGMETETSLTLATEPVTPLGEFLQREDGKNELAISWGLHQIAKGLVFLSQDCSLVHGNICLSSVFVDQAGEWKLGGFEYIRPFSDSLPEKRTESHKVYDPPEAGKSHAMKRSEKWSWDMWGLGCLIWEIFNGPLPRSSSLKSISKIPKSLVAHYCELVGANPKSRPSPASFIEDGRAGHFMDNEFVATNLKLEEMQFMDNDQRLTFFKSLNQSLDTFPKEFGKYKILPLLLNAFEFGGAGSAILPPLLKLGKLLDSQEYQSKIIPCLVKLFSSSERSTRIHLLQQLGQFIEHLQPSTVDSQIFPHVAEGFSDTVPAVREATVKAMVLLTPKLSEKTINNQLLKQFASLQMDKQAGIRTNTTICLGKVVSCMAESTRQKVISAAFIRALRDPFPPARTAGIVAMSQAISYYKPSDMANRVIPAVAPLTLDPEKEVRDMAFQTIQLFLSKLQHFSDHPEDIPKQDSSSYSSAVVGTASTFAGWAYSSLASRLGRNTGEGAKTQPDAVVASSPAKAERRKAEEKRPDEGAAIQKKKDNDIKLDDNDDEEWGALESEEQDRQSTSDLEGWEDDGWSEGKVEDKSNASFFNDSTWDAGWGESKTGTAKSSSTFVKDSSFPPASSLFEEPPADKEVKDGWGDDDDDWGTLEVENASAKGSDLKTSGWDGEGWGSFEDTKPAVKVASAVDKAQQREQRRQRQKEEKEKRAQEGKKSRPLKLGGVKKSD